MSWQTIFERNPVVVTRQVAGDVFLVPVQGHLADLGRLYALTGVGEYVWLSLDAKRSLKDIHQGMLDTFDVDDPQAEGDLREFVDLLVSADLVRLASGAPYSVGDSWQA